MLTKSSIHDHQRAVEEAAAQPPNPAPAQGLRVARPAAQKAKNDQAVPSIIHSTNFKAMNHPISLSGRDGLQKVSRPSPAGCRAQTPFSSEPGWIVAGRAMKPGFEQPRHLPYSPNPRRLVGIPLIVTAGSLLTRTAAVVIGFLLCFRQSHVLAETTTVRLDSIGGVDTFVRSSVPTMTNAAEVRLNVGGWGDTYQTFIKFPTSALPAGFTSVKLMLYCQDSNLAGSGTTVSQTLQVPATGWTETITWNTRPSLTALRNLPTPPTVGMWFELDLTSLAQGWKAGSPNNGFTLVPQGTANQWNNYASSRAVDTTKRPFLIFDDANPVMDPTLRAYYPFTGGTGIDASGNNQHAILTDITQITGPNSVSGDAALFNGTSSGAAVSTTIAMTNQQTMAGWCFSAHRRPAHHRQSRARVRRRGRLLSRFAARWTR